MNEAVVRVTEGNCRSTRATSKNAETPLGSNPPAPVKAENTTATVQGQAIDKEVTVLLMSDDKKACLPKKQPTSKRSKPMLGPQRQTDHKTLAAMKLEKDFNLETVSKEIVFKDCHVMTDDSSYADWLLSQGIDDSIPLRKILKMIYIKTLTHKKPLVLLQLKVKVAILKQIQNY